MKEEQPGFLAKMAQAFITKGRISLLLLIGFLSLGFFAYTTLLPREGFPAVNVPDIFINVEYAVGDTETVNEDVTEPIEAILADMDLVVEVQTITQPNSALIIAEIPFESEPNQGRQEIKSEIDGAWEKPLAAIIEYITIDAAAWDGEHSLILSLIGEENQSTTEIQEQAELIRKELIKSRDIAVANVIENVVEKIDPQTGETFIEQEEFSRVGLINSNDELEFFEAVYIGVNPRSGVDSIQLSESVEEQFEKAEEKGLLEGYRYDLSLDQADDVNRDISNLQRNLLQGLAAVVVILFFFVNWRASLLTAIFIPTVIAATFVLMLLVGYTLNVLTLFALILVLGLFVDDAIVVIEAIDYKKRQGYKGVEAVRAAINDIGLADLSGTITTVLVFLPLTFVSGILGEFIIFIPITVILALTISIIIALTLVPYMGNAVMADSQEEKKEKSGLDTFFNGFTEFINNVGQATGNLARNYLSSTGAAIAAFLLSIGLIAGGMFTARFVAFDIFPQPKDGLDATIAVSYPFGTTGEEAEEVAQEIEAIVLQVAEGDVERAIWIRDQNEPGTFRYQLQMALTPYADRDRTGIEIAEDLNEALEDYPTSKASVLASQLAAGPPSSDFPLQMPVFGENPEQVAALQNDIIDYLLSEEHELSDDATVVEAVADNPNILQKLDGRRFSIVKAKFDDPDKVGTTGLMTEAQQNLEDEFDEDRVKSYGLDDDSLQFGFGQEAEFAESFSGMAIGGLVAILGMYIVLILLYNSFLQPLLILFSVPFSFVLLFPGLAITNNPLGFFTMMGIIALIGITVNNSIILVDFANQARAKGAKAAEAAADAVAVRFRPIVTTSITTVVALLPLAISDPFWEALSFSIIFGVISSTIMLLLFFPVYYVAFERMRDVKSLFQMAKAEEVVIREQVTHSHRNSDKKKDDKQDDGDEREIIQKAEKKNS